MENRNRKLIQTRNVQKEKIFVQKANNSKITEPIISQAENFAIKLQQCQLRFQKQIKANDLDDQNLAVLRKAYLEEQERVAKSKREKEMHEQKLNQESLATKVLEADLYKIKFELEDKNQLQELELKKHQTEMEFLQNKEAREVEEHRLKIEHAEEEHRGKMEQQRLLNEIELEIQREELRRLKMENLLMAERLMKLQNSKSDNVRCETESDTLINKSS